MEIVHNPFRPSGLPIGALATKGAVRADASGALALMAHCPAAQVTPLLDRPDMARALGLDTLVFKDERTRMAQGSFKALGAAHAIAKAALARQGAQLFQAGQANTALSGMVFTAATAGNHGLSVAVGARLFGARAVIFIANSVPEAFRARLLAAGADVRRQGDTYEDSLAAATGAADENGWALLSDTSWPGYEALPLDVMEGYLVMAHEVVTKMRAPADFVFLQAGVGGLAAAVAAHLRLRWGDAFRIFIVEPTAAPALQASVRAGAPVVTAGPVSDMGRLDCKEPSHLALASLARTADYFVTISDGAVADALPRLARAGLATTASGGAGYAALEHLAKRGFDGLSGGGSALVFLTEGPSDG